MLSYRILTQVFLSIITVHYGDELASVIKNMLLVSKVAGLSKDLEKKKARGLTFLNQIDSFPSFRVDSYDIDGSLASDSGGDPSSPLGDAKGMVIDEERKCKFTETLSQSQKVRLTEMLGEWEEPETVHDAEVSSGMFKLSNIPKLD